MNTEDFALPKPLTRKERRRLDDADAREADAALADRRPLRGVTTYSPPKTYRCVGCRQDRDGRFTRHKLASGGGWDQGQHLPFWYCWTCLPLGEGRGEVEP